MFYFFGKWQSSEKKWPLKKGKCKSKFTNAVKKYVLDQEDFDSIDEDILEVLVNKYDLDIADGIHKLPPCLALLSQLKKEGKQNEIVEKGTFILVT